MDKLNWFPLSFAKDKRKKILEIIEALNNKQNKEQISNQYLSEREKLLKIEKSNTQEYPPFDHSGFDRYIKSRSFEKSDENEELEHHLYKLQFYYNPDIF